MVRQVRSARSGPSIVPYDRRQFESVISSSRKKSIRCVINHLNIDYKSKINYRLISYIPRNN